MRDVERAIVVTALNGPREAPIDGDVASDVNWRGRRIDELTAELQNFTRVLGLRLGLASPRE